MDQALRVETAGVHAMATRWSASVGDLHQMTAPTGLGLSCQSSAADRATGVVRDHASYLAQDAASTAAVAAVFQPMIRE